jgi:hypothetical protein
MGATALAAGGAVEGWSGCTATSPMGGAGETVGGPIGVGATVSGSSDPASGCWAWADVAKPQLMNNVPRMANQFPRMDVFSQLQDRCDMLPAGHGIDRTVYHGACHVYRSSPQALWIGFLRKCEDRPLLP